MTGEISMKFRRCRSSRRVERDSEGKCVRVPALSSARTNKPIFYFAAQQTRISTVDYGKISHHDIFIKLSFDIFPIVSLIIDVR